MGPSPNCEEFMLIGGPFDGATFHLEKDDISGNMSIILPPGQPFLWQIASFDEGGKFIRFLSGALDSTAWRLYQYAVSNKEAWRYNYAGIKIQGNGKSTTADILARLKGET